MKSKAFKARVGDANYALRIGVQLVLQTLQADPTSDTGFGLWTPATGPDDNEYRYVVVDVDEGHLFVCSDWKKPKPGDRIATPTAANIRSAMRAALEQAKPKPKAKPKAKPKRKKAS
jgi:hypothetical protein